MFERLKRKREELRRLSAVLLCLSMAAAGIPSFGFYHSGIFPPQGWGKVASCITRTAGVTAGINPGDTVRLYYKPQTKLLEMVENACTVEESGHMSVTLTR